MTSTVSARSTGRAGLAALAGSLTSAVSGFVLTIVVARLWDAQGAGVVLQTIAAFSIVLAVARLGADSAAMWQLPRLAVDRPGLLRGTTTRLVLTAVAGGVVGAVALVVLRDTIAGDTADLADALAATAVFVPLTAVALVALSALRALGDQTRYVGLGNVALPVLRLVAVALIGLLGGTAVDAAIGWAAMVPPVLAAALVFVLADVRRAERASGIRGSWKVAPEQASLLRRWTPGRTAQAVLEQAVTWLDVVVVGLIAGPVAAGLYGVASRLVAAGFVIDTAVRMVVSPRFSRLLHQGRLTELASLYRTATTWLVLGAAPVYVTLALFAPGVLALYGAEFTQAGAALAVLCVGGVALAAAGPVHALLLMQGRSGTAAGNKAVAVAVMVAGDLLLVPVWGITGAAVAWTAATVLDAALAGYQVRAGAPVRVGAGVLLPLALGALPAAAIGAVVLAVSGAHLAGAAVTAVSGLAVTALLTERLRTRLHVTSIAAVLRSALPKGSAR